MIGYTGGEDHSFKKCYRQQYCGDIEQCDPPRKVPTTALFTHANGVRCSTALQEDAYAYVLRSGGGGALVWHPS